MDMGDAPAWVGAGLGLAAFIVSLRSVKHSKRAADAAEGSATAAEQSVVETRRSSDAAERSAAAAEETLADQRREVAERRRQEEEASRPRAKFRIEHRSRAVWELINYGTARAENVCCLDAPGARDEWPTSLSVAAGDVYPFMMVGSMAEPIPSVLRVVWEGQDEPVPLRVPPRLG
ncbi:hypothetical protein [Streptomyces sp. AK02-01A]|uniref:hypothetical protein n=1 Tax=Streptomyces sp. AK02-01A TaxID=3028648 RepID=UPI0029AD723B|nr:hypothetical protein [Streptomyces sp. AK02-01A]MDX3855743.1 hypothetical protein [Streptomyces sp. AK02-01A]